jgi:periplasmic divalent cation tolerance protein
MDALVVLCTCPDATVAERIARALVEERLAACVNRLSGVVSAYRWNDAVEVADEVLLVIKTSRDRYPALQARVIGLHPYDVPELIALEAVDGLPAYLQWLTDATSA